jgi:hypothetical protein
VELGLESIDGLLASHEEEFFVAWRSTFVLRAHSTCYALDDNRPLFRLSHFESSPLASGPMLDPLAHRLERSHLLLPASTPPLRTSTFQVADQHVGRHGQQIPLSHFRQSPSETRRMAHFVVAGHASVRQQLATRSQHLKGEVLPPLMTKVIRHAALLPMLPVLGALLGQIESLINQRVFLPRDIRHVNAELAVCGAAGSTRPLSCYTNRIISLLRVRRWVEYQERPGSGDHTVRFADPRCDLPREFVQ